MSPAPGVEPTRPSARGARSARAVPETQSVAVAVLHVEVATAVGLVANRAGNHDALGPELAIKGVGIINPDVRVPGVLRFRVGKAVGTHDARRGELGQHDDDAATVDHAEAWGLAPEA